MVPDAHVLGVQPLCNRGMSGARILVPQDQLERARTILEGLAP